MNINETLGMIKAILVICALGSIAAGIVKVILASKKGRGKWYKFRTIVFSILAAVIFMIFNMVLSGEADQSGNYIKAQHPAGIPNITFGQAIDRVCGNQKWSRMTSQSTTSGQAVVQMDADCIYADGKHKITIQFSYGVEEFELIDENTPFEITFAGFDDAEETSISDMQDMIYEMFEHYADQNGMALNPSARNTVLYSEGMMTGKILEDLGRGGTADEATEAEKSTDYEELSESSTAYVSEDEIVILPQGWMDPSEVIDVMEMAGHYEGLVESSNVSLSIYSGATEEEMAAGEVGNASVYIGPNAQVHGGELYEGILITLGNNEYLVANDTGHEVLLQVSYFRGLFLDLYIDGEHIDIYHMVEPYIS